MHSCLLDNININVVYGLPTPLEWVMGSNRVWKIYASLLLNW